MDSSTGRKRGRTALIVAVAAVLGVAGGTAVGYGIQAQREPTPLPALSQQDLRHPAPLPKGHRAKPLSAAEDRKVRTDGDLRKLLLPRPSGAKSAGFGFGDGWMSVTEYVSEFDHPSVAFSYQMDNELRRVAAVSWRTGKYRTTEIRLVQFRSGVVQGAREHALSQQGYMPQEDFARNEGEPLAGTGNGRYYVFPVDKEPGYLDMYQARAYAYRGDIMLEIFMHDTKKISPKDIKSVAERQLGRL
ncbi:hypothetical protein ACGFMM_09025 [Streptomyces sp. NPDC048604]|uniref:hypothetical protein n=1 Tax=Streptomyces sp. NPDC048604 TaxID=3365578 RepID=UPI00371F6D6D